MRVNVRKICYTTVALITSVFVWMRTNHVYFPAIAGGNLVLDPTASFDWPNRRMELLTSDSIPRKVLLLSYMRGGSKIGGEVFNSDPGAIMWHEPMAAYFMANYGLSSAHLPQRIFFDDNDEKVEFSSKETIGIAEYATNLYNCRFNEVPPQTWMHKFLFFMNSDIIETLRFCLKPARQHGMVDICKHLGLSCPNIPGSRSKNCPEIINTTRSILQNLQSLPDVSNEVHKEKLYSQIKEHFTEESYFHEPKKQLILEILKHEICVENMRRENLPCMQRSIQQCHNIGLHVLKVNRMRMEDVEEILIANPDLFIIHYVRDPRAIALSRVDKGFCIRKNECGIVEEARIICRRMRDDIDQRQILESKYPNSTLVVKYENLVIEPILYAKKMYGFIGMEHSAETDWEELSYNLIFGHADKMQMRVNGTESIDKWKKGISGHQIKIINGICDDVLRNLGYKHDDIK